MRSDLTAAFRTKMAAAARKPRQLAVFHFADGDACISDQALGAADGLANEYEALVEDWGRLADVGDAMNKEAGEVRQMTMSIWNGGDTPFGSRFLSQDPEDVLVDVYQWFTGLSDGDKALIDRFACQDPIATDEVSRLLKIDLVSLPMRYDGPLGSVIKVAEWYNCPDENIGKYLPIILGDPGYVPAISVRSAPKCTLNGSILDDTTVIPANEDLDERGFEQTGVLQIGSERIAYSSRTDSAFTVSQRGADGTVAAEHLNQEEIQQHVTDFTYLVADHALGAISNVKVAGLPAPESIYTAYPALSPSRIVFTEKPYALAYAKGSSFLEMHCDAVAAANTALYPHLAYDSAAVTSAAQISEDNPLLAITQVTENPDRGEIVKAYVAVEWASSRNALQHDRVSVSIPGIGTLGRLERPSEYDDLAMDAEVDLDHGHSHSISGEHSHLLSDPLYATDETAHGHGSSNLSQQVRIHAPSQVHVPMTGEPRSVTLTGCYSSYAAATLHFNVHPEYGCSFSVQGSGYRLGGIGESFFAISPSGSSVTISFKWEGDQFPSITLNIYDIWIDYVINSAVEPAYTGVSVSKAADGSMDGETDKATDDVQDLATENRELIVNDTGMMTKTVVELFDVTAYVNLAWGWFTGKEIRVQYEGDVDEQTIFLYHVFFEVEYRRVERIFSDEVTCEPLGLIDDGDGAYTGTPSAQISRPDHARKYLLMNRGGLPLANIDSDSFDAAGVRYAEEDYTFDGILEGSMSVREADKLMARQCRSRFFWEGGKTFIKFREFQAEWSFDKTITQATGALRLKGMSMERKSVRDMINRVHLYYYRDWTAEGGGIDAFGAMASAQNNESISRHGVREQPDRFMFDLVKNPSMASDLAEFYKEDGAPSSFYTIEAFLPYFDLQKEDHVRLTHDFTDLRKAAMRIASIERQFGSGKLGSMNLLRIVAETWYRLISIAKQDTVTVGDILNIEMQFGLDFQTTVRVTDFINFGFNFEDEVSVADALAIVVSWVLSESDTVTVSDDLAVHMDIALGDSVVVNDWLDSEIGSGYGLRGYGMSPYGSQGYLDSNPIEFIAVLDELAVAMSVALSDSVTVTDELIFSSGYGSPWEDGAGYGEAPYGR